MENKKVSQTSSRVPQNRSRGRLWRCARLPRTHFLSARGKLNIISHHVAVLNRKKSFAAAVQVESILKLHHRSGEGKKTKTSAGATALWLSIKTAPPSIRQHRGCARNHFDFSSPFHPKECSALPAKLEQCGGNCDCFRNPAISLRTSRNARAQRES